MKILYIILISLLLFSGTVSSASASERQAFNENWRFARFGQLPDGSQAQEQADLQSPQAIDASWRLLDLPHDWGIEGPFSMDLPGHVGRLPWVGIGWYRKSFNLPDDLSEGRFYLDIDGAMMMPKVWLNGHFVGEWAYGYTSFRLDLTPFLKAGENILAVRVENVPNSTRWYPGSGLYRNVWLVKTGPVAVDHWGTFVNTTDVSRQSATVRVVTTLRNDKQQTVRAKLRHTLLDPAGKTAAVFDSEAVEIPASGKASVNVAKSIPTPQLWDVKIPNLYTCRTEVIVGEKVVERENVRFGIREANWSAKEGFLLNGQRLPIQGVCLHHDLGAIGAAFNTSAARRQLLILREMGCNAIRTAHNPPAPEFLDLCDELGMLVLVDAFDTWQAGKSKNTYNRFFKKWHERDIVNLVRRDRNHPSVIMWCSGNEIIEFGSGTPENIALSRRLTELFHREDPTRPVSIANNRGEAIVNGIIDTVDVVGYNYKAIKAKTPNYLSHIQARPDLPLYGSETSSCVSSRGEYFFPVSSKMNENLFNFQISSYDLAAPPWAYIPDVEFDSLDRYPQIAGEFVWTGFDYLGEPTPFTQDLTNAFNFSDKAQGKRALEAFEKYGKAAPSRSSYFGIVDLAGLPKDRYYLYQARWRPDLPMAHIIPHWTWPGREGEITPVFVYTSGDEAELFLNGKSLGIKKRSPQQYRFRWDDVRYQPGELEVRVKRNGESWAKSVVRTAGEPVRLALSTDKTTLAKDSSELIYIMLEAKDKAGNFVPASDASFSVKVEGAAEFVAADNGDPTDLRTFSDPSRSLFNGKAIVIVRALKGAEGSAIVRISSSIAPTASLQLKISAP